MVSIRGTMTFINFLEENVDDIDFVETVKKLNAVYESAMDNKSEVPVDVDNLNDEIMATVQDRYNKIKENDKENNTLSEDIKMALSKTNTDINTKPE